MTITADQPILDPFELAGSLSGKHFIDGELRPSASGRGFHVINPATRKAIGEAAAGDARDVDAAVAAAARAQKQWRAISARERGKIVAEAGRRLAGHAEELARLVALESGKALRTECRPEAVATAEVFSFFGGLAPEIKGETVPLKPTALTYTVREPVGVVAAILPWNVPLILMAHKIAPALVAGNGVVVKSAEETPFGVLRAIQLLNTVLPKGLLNVVSGSGPDCGGPLVEHKDVRKVTFTGSVETGKLIARGAAQKLIPATLELGGKSPMIVMPDADMAKAVEGAVTGMRFTRQGQSCTAASRMLVHDSIADEFVDRLRQRVDAMKMGDPLQEETDIGTVISPQQFEKINNYIALGENEPGAVAHRCSRLPEEPALRDGLFIRPVIFTGLPANCRVVREEIFGPVACVIPFSSAEEALRMANDSEFGLAATVWTNDLKLALTAANELEAGIVQINQNQVAGPNMSFGGVKQSGLGREGSHHGMDDYVEIKYLCLGDIQK